MNNLSDVDAKTNALLQKKAMGLGKGTPFPVRDWAPPDGINNPENINKNPPSVNPEVDQLHFKPAEEARDVAKRLESYGQISGEAIELTLLGSLRQAQRTSREYLTAEEDYMIAAISVLIQQHAFDPQLMASTTVGVATTNTDGDPNSLAPLSILNTFGLTQNLPDGGKLAANLIWTATDNLRQEASGSYSQSSALVLSANFPLLRGAGPVASESLIQAERSLVYAARTFENFRRSFLVSISSDFFNLVQQDRQLRNQEESVKTLRGLETRTKALVESGRLAEFQLNIASSDVLSATAQMANQREQFILSLDRFKVRLGLSVNSEVRLKAEGLLLPDPAVTPEEAVALALDYRLDLQTQRDKVDDSRRQVANAKNALLPDANLFGTITGRTFPGSPTRLPPRDGGFVYNSDDIVYAGGVTINWPLDRTNENYALRQQIISLQQAQRALDNYRDNIVIEVRSRVREIDRARFNLELQERSVLINQRRLEEQDLKADQVTAQQVVDTANSLVQAQNARDQALTDLRNAVLNYLLSTGQLRVKRDGTLEMLPGMMPEGAPPEAKTPLSGPNVPLDQALPPIQDQLPLPPPEQPAPPPAPPADPVPKP